MSHWYCYFFPAIILKALRTAFGLILPCLAQQRARPPLAPPVDDLERDLISQRTKKGLSRAKAQGKLLGRPKGTLGKSKLDGHEKEIKNYVAKGVNVKNVARIADMHQH